VCLEFLGISLLNLQNSTQKVRNFSVFVTPTLHDPDPDSGLIPDPGPSLTSTGRTVVKFALSKNQTVRRDVIVMSSSQLIVFLGAPTAKEALSTWTGGLPVSQDDTNLPLFSVDSRERTSGVTWRHLVDPVESLSQELSQASVRPTTPEDGFLERSLRLFNYDDADDGDDMDLCDMSELSDFSFSQIGTPFIKGYDFDINEIMELQDLPPANVVMHSPQRNYSFIVAILAISPCQTVDTKYGKSIALVKLSVADQTKSNLEIACWENMARMALSLRVDDIVYFSGLSRSRYI
jgi:hypothetical protein